MFLIWWVFGSFSMFSSGVVDSTLEDCTSHMSASLDELEQSRSEGIELTPRPTAIIVTSPPQTNSDSQQQQQPVSQTTAPHQPPPVDSFKPVPYKEVSGKIRFYIKKKSLCGVRR